MIKKYFIAAAAVFSAVCSGEVTAYRNGKDLYVQSRFSETQDIVIGVWREANERAWLVPRNSDIRQASKGVLLHINSDEYPATSFSSYGFLSGNHGSAAGRLVTAPDHGFTDADSGKIITDEKNNRYVFIRVQNKNQFIMHPEPKNAKAPVGRAQFFRHSKEKLFLNGKEIKFKSSALGQLRPLNVVTKSVFLIDGKTPLPDKKVVKCQFVDHVFEHGVIAPEAAVKYVKEKASEKTAKFMTIMGKMFYPEVEKGFDDYAALPRIMTVKNLMRYQDNGAMVNTRTCIYPVSLSGVSQMDIMFGWVGEIAKGNYQMFYIPKTKLHSFKGHKDKTRVYDKVDFVKGVDIAKGFDVNARTSITDAADANNPPDRFIRVTGKNSPQYGIALGYSLFDGATARGCKQVTRNTFYHHWYTRKMYPYVYSLYNNKPGLTVRTVSYKQYFAPANEPDATAFYYHKQGTSDVIYFETHKNLSGKKLQLPARMNGKKITVLEKTPSVTLKAGQTVTPSGIVISSTGNYGHIVLKLD